jgi:hypothetical protein
LRIEIRSLAAATLLAVSGCAAPQPRATADTPTSPPAATAEAAKPAAPAPTAITLAAPTTAPAAVVAASTTPAPAASAPSREPAASPGDGRTYPGPYFLGRAAAPVTIDEYADFQ